MVLPVVMYGYESWTIKKSTEELMLLNCGAEEDSCKSLGLQGDQASQSKGSQPWVFTGRTDAEVEAPIFWPLDVKSWLIGKDPTLMLGKIKGGGEGDNRGQDGWIALLTQWTWVWANSGKQWRIGKPGKLQFMGLQRVGQDLVTE